MNTNLTQIIIETIEQSKQVLGEGFDFAKKETPLLIREFLDWKFAEAMFIIVFLVAGTALIIKLAQILCKKADANRWFMQDELKVISFVVSISIILATLVTTFLYAKDAIQLKIAPRVYLVEWVAKNVIK